MNFFSVSIYSIQHISSFRVEIDLRTPKLLCLVGRNGVGKTTLMRALRNLSSGDTFLKTANPQIFSAESRIRYQLDDVTVEFSYDPDIRSLNCKQEIPVEARQAVTAELPMPYGARFNFFRSASDADRDIRQALVVADYKRPDELIEFLSSIYATDKYEQLVEVAVRGRAYYSILLADDKYIREDYLSSGEYFLINLYRTIKGAAKLIAVDEIELSLDAAAQAQLAGWLRSFCTKYGCTILFTTHSLAVMRTLSQDELAYVEQAGSDTVHYPASYSYVKARLFGFQGYDKYILTEDIALKQFIEYLIHDRCPSTFFAYKVIHIGGGYQVTDLLRRNEAERFLSDPVNVMAILDGDQQGEAHARHDDVHFVPFESVEKAIYAHYGDADFPFRLPQPRSFGSAKEAFNAIRARGIATPDDLHGYLCAKYPEGVRQLAQVLSAFLGVRVI